MAILSTNQKLIKVDVDYSAGNGIDITSGVISVTGDNAPYSAGQNIYFDGDDDHVINGKDWGNEINDASANAFNTASSWVAQNYANSADMTYISAMVDTKLDTSSFSDVSGNFYTNDNPSGFITGVDLSNYYTKDETSGKEELASAFANIPVGDPEVNAYVTSHSASIDESTNVVQSNSSTWNDVTAYQSNSANYITAHQSLEGLMSASLLESADGKWTAYNSIPFKAGDEFPVSADEAIQCVQTNSGNWNEISAYELASGNYLTAVDLTPYQTTAGMTAYQPVGDYATTADLALKQDTLTFGYDEQDRISAINNSALAGGGEVPEGTMVESNLEYNAVGEISGYGNSAIAQYGAEKQWLQHDDTIVHVANSAQYAFGVQIPNVAKLMGVDETLLFSSSPTTFTSAFTANETIANFDRIRVSQMVFTDNEYITENHDYNTEGILLTNKMNVGFTYIIDNGWKCWGSEKYNITNGTDFTMARAGRNFIGPNTTAGFGFNDSMDVQNGWIYKVVGIHRINGGN